MFLFLFFCKKICIWLAALHFDCSTFSIQVMYDTTGFLEKNRDLLHLDSIQLLSSCTCHLPQIFASNMLTQSEKPVVGPLYKSGGADSQKLSVATKFKVHSHLSFTNIHLEILNGYMFLFFVPKLYRWAQYLPYRVFLPIYMVLMFPLWPYRVFILKLKLLTIKNLGSQLSF